MPKTNLRATAPEINSNNPDPKYWNAILAAQGLSVEAGRQLPRREPSGRKIVRTNHNTAGWKNHRRRK